MTDILLAHSFFLRFDPKQWHMMKPYAPLGTLYAAACLRQNGYAVSLFDSMLAKETRAIIPLLKSHQPRVVVFFEDSFNWLSKMCLSRMREACFEMIGLVKEHCGDYVPVIVAGSDPTDHQEMYFNHGADYAIVGEGEISLTEVINALLGKSGKSYADIPGLAFPENGTVRRTAPRGFQKDLDAFPFPAWDLLDVDQYRQMWRRKHGYYSLNLVTTRGCPFRCNWCAKPIYGDRYSCRSPENVVAEMVWLRENVRPDQLWFADDIFGLKPGWVQQFGEAVHAARVATPFTIQARVDLLHEEAVAGLKKAGCKTVWVGAESGSQRILDAMDKGITVDQIRSAVARLRRYGIEVCLFLQFGYPGETDDDIEKTITLVRDCQPDDIGISVSYPLPGTRFYERVRGTMGEKQNWEHSNDLDLMFQGHYQPDFYRQLHRVVHQEFRLRKTARLVSHVCRHPSELNLNNIRRLMSATMHLPQLYWDRAALARLKIPNQRLV
jgi:anaerobic magnesium-protoporphyrin IX monomethyl ester cyclase